MKLPTCLAALALLSACSDSKAAPAGTAVECALAGSGAFAKDCTMQREDRDGQSLLVIRHPDGGFRRFELGTGSGIVTADGMQPAQVQREDGMVELRVGADRYRLPVRE